jgi:hypothetical protein
MSIACYPRKIKVLSVSIKCYRFFLCTYIHTYGIRLVSFDKYYISIKGVD